MYPYKTCILEVFKRIFIFFQQIAAILTLPFDVIKTHRQISLGETRVKGKIGHNISNRLTLKLLCLFDIEFSSREKGLINSHQFIRFEIHA